MLLRGTQNLKYEANGDEYTSAERRYKRSVLSNC